MVEAEFILGGLEAVLDGPAMPFHLHQRVDWRPGRTPCREEGQIAIGDVAPDQQAARPGPGPLRVVFGGVEVGQQYAQSCNRAPLVPSPADRRSQSAGARLCATVSALPAIACGLRQDWTQ
jgi:hypothetical protein